MLKKDGGIFVGNTPVRNFPCISFCNTGRIPPLLYGRTIIKKRVMFSSNSNYDPEISKLLARCCELTYVQYDNGRPPENPGKIDPPPGYTQVASFQAPELNFNKDLQKFSGFDFAELSEDKIKELEQKVADIQRVYFGFALTSSEDNIIALRGTRSIFEWIMDATIPQVEVPRIWFDDSAFKQARVHMGFLALFLFLVPQILDAIQHFNTALPCYITGHSLGGALSTLAPIPVKLMTGNDEVRMYNFASPRVGNPTFAKAYNSVVPDSYRIVNLVDLITIVPPDEIFDWDYQHIGTEWSFLNQSGDVGKNHALTGENNYRVAVEREIPTDASRTYPTAGL